MPNHMRMGVFVIITLIAVCGGSQAADSKAGPIDFVRDIRPIFEAKCTACHGPKVQMGNLRLDVKGKAILGGFSKSAIVPGHRDKSVLIQYVSGVGEKVMPPQGERLSPQQIELLRQWIDGGAVWPDGLDAEDPVYWAYAVPVCLDLPPVQNTTWVRNPIDRFIMARLDEEGIEPSPEADRRTLIRRLKLDLHGLPPTPEEVDAFVRDERPDAVERLVDRLLASPQYGERMAQFWLDVVGYADSNGFETNLPRDHAWHYRDYVIEAFNRDIPYPQFIFEQLAGDTVGEDRATGFLVTGPYDNVKSPDLQLTLQQRQDELNRMIVTTSGTFLGMTVGCARCHDHKFDPISQREYYSMQAIFAGVFHGDREITDPQRGQKEREARHVRALLSDIDRRLVEFESLAESYPLCVGAPNRPPVRPEINIDRFSPVRAKYVRFKILATDGSQPCLDELEVWSTGEASRNVALAEAGTRVRASSTLPGYSQHALEHINDGQYGNEQSWISNEVGKGWVELEFLEPVRIDRVIWSRDRNGVLKDRIVTDYAIEIALSPEHWSTVATSADRISYQGNSDRTRKPLLAAADPVQQAFTQQKDKLIDKLRLLTEMKLAYAGRFDEPEATFLLNRGDPMQKQAEVVPTMISVLGNDFELPASCPEQERRIQLAKWIGSPNNPATARVMVNRIWLQHFGEGLVSTPSDFGHMGSPPSHPQLLDWLAVEFITSGWSVKQLHRAIVLSSTYRQASYPQAKGLDRDSGCRLLWRFPPRRLDAEAIRDSILAVSGKLDFTMGGPGFSTFEPNDNYVRVYIPKTNFGPQEWRRMIYMHKVRMELDATFGSFDCPDGGQNAAKRNRSTTPIQALNLLNGNFVLQLADLFAQRVQQEASGDIARQVRRGYALIFQREPDAEELAAAVGLVSEYGLAAFARAAFNSNEFLFIN